MKKTRISNENYISQKMLKMTRVTSSLQLKLATKIPMYHVPLICNYRCHFIILTLLCFGYSPLQKFTRLYNWLQDNFDNQENKEVKANLHYVCIISNKNISWVNWKNNNQTLGIFLGFPGYGSVTPFTVLTDIDDQMSKCSGL